MYLARRPVVRLAVPALAPLVVVLFVRETPHAGVLHELLLPLAHCLHGHRLVRTATAGPHGYGRQAAARGGGGGSGGETDRQGNATS